MGIFLPAIEMAGYLCLMPMASLGGTIADNHYFFLLVSGKMLTNISDSHVFKYLCGALGLVACMRPQRGLR